ncbi:hypothetical protein B5X24_HaOG213079 [Helicoverpa armigera]|nr:hypothetical protein B5X24_HaOG213079 [Helicoverpa armigera]
MFNDDNYVFGDQNVQVPAHLNFGKFLLDRLRLHKDEVALELGDTREKLTYKEFTQYAVNMSVALTKLGVGRGDIVAVGSEKRNEFVPTVLAIVFTGATYTPYDLKSGRAALKHKISLTRPKYFICSNHFWNTYSDILKSFDCIEKFVTLDDGTESVISIRTLVTDDADVNKFEPVQVQGQSDIAFILYSSGTTGMPKGVQLTHLNCILNSLPDDFSDESLKTAFLFGEWYHNYDTFMTYKFLLLGRKIVYINEAEPVTFLKTVQDCDVNIAFIVPSFVCYLSKAKEAEKCNLDSLKIIYSRSSPLHNKTIQEVVDPETRKTVGPKQRGEIRLRGPVFMKGYIGVPPSEYLDEDGFFKTGDLGYYDEDKYFYIVERIKEIIVYDGYKIAPLELETILQLHPAVKEAGVVPPFMQLRGGVRFIEEMPRNPRGKIIRQRLREMLK